MINDQLKRQYKQPYRQKQTSSFFVVLCHFPFTVITFVKWMLSAALPI